MPSVRTLPGTDHSEAAAQSSVILWFDAVFREFGLTDPRVLFAVPNGGKRSKITGLNLQRQGLRAGVPDLFLSVPRGGYHGCYVEMKVEGGRRSIEQITAGKSLLEQGYLVVTPYGSRQAIQHIEHYLNLPICGP